ncbi:MAPEG family protein [Roseicyclus sp. F158]|uniref:MAPEG family protein n=1 Tax=Tropicimonas omnivorans TaxID=3075590 RepID=A0ABU3DDD4_9RHOB|nr:MAPEG family protein [Roseicyclus sp. F158]MDT0681728.1 MAPEG family protein [Roseicyclus sp. F158]
MTPELFVLVLAGLLQGVQFALMAIPANRDLGPGYTMSARDREPSRELSPLAGRMKRAFDNHFEALILFAPIAIVISLTGQSTVWTTSFAWLYLAARVLYIPAYAAGWRPWRSFIWMAGFFATMALYVAALI